MSSPKLIRDLFVSKVTRDIPPVVYFHEQSPAKLADEVSEYIITGGWPEGTPNHRRVPHGIHEAYVGLLEAISDELEKKGGPDLPNVWISGFYGSGKSSFAKLLGLALDGIGLPDERALSQALIQRNHSPRAKELQAAWDRLKQKIEPIAAVFDVGGIARDNEQVHAAAVRQVQKRLGYCSTEPLVADFELKLERDGQWAQFLDVAEKTLGKPWSQVKDKALAEEDFSWVMSEMDPDKYPDPMAWFGSRAGLEIRLGGPEEATKAIRDMLKYRAPNATLFLVIDEVSQYVLSNKDRVDRLRAFATSLGSTLKGKAWLVALGQQKVDQDADDSFLVWAQDRFPPRLRVHLAQTNIRDVVHQRLLRKDPKVTADLRALFERHRSDLKLFAYQCDDVTPDEFVEVYPMLPKHIDLLLQITSALRTRSKRSQGDDQAIRGLLQLLGELFRAQKLADKPVGTLVSLDDIYEIQHSALDSDTQASMARILAQCTEDETGLKIRCAKAVALLELIQDTEATTAKLVAQCLYDRVDRGNQVPEITEALETLRRANLLGYSQKSGYKIQSSAGEEWERDRREIGVPRELISDMVKDQLKTLLGGPERPRLQGRSFPWGGLYSDGRHLVDAAVANPHDDAHVRVDFHFVSKDERTASTWVKRSAGTALENRLVWVAGDNEPVEHQARELGRSMGMVRKFEPRKDSLNPGRVQLLQQEKGRVEELQVELSKAVTRAWMHGQMYFRGRGINPTDHGATFSVALNAAATRILADLFPHYVSTQITPSELNQLLDAELSGPSAKFGSDDLGILELDSGKHVAACGGVVPHRIKEYIEAQDGVGGAGLLARFGGPPYGYTPSVVKACIAGLLRGGKLKVQPEAGADLTAIRDTGVRELFDKDRPFRRATFYPAGKDDIGFSARARIGKFFQQRLNLRIDLEDHAIADAVAQQFPHQSVRLREVLTRLGQLPGFTDAPVALTQLGTALERCLGQVRQTKPTVQAVKRNLDALHDGFETLARFDGELTTEAIAKVKTAVQVRDHAFAQLSGLELEAEVAEAGRRLQEHLGTERPWQDIAGLDEDLATILAAYAAERGRRLQRQEQKAEQARSRLRTREGFSTLTADRSHRVLRPLTEAITDTTEAAIAPSLDALDGPFLLNLAQAETQANDQLDEYLEPFVHKIDLQLRGRELKTCTDIEELVSEIRKRLSDQLADNTVLRLL